MTKLGILLSVLIMTLSSSAARATTYIIAYSGVVATESIDSGGFFGGVNASLLGKHFVATYTADDTIVGAHYNSSPEFTTLFGGPGFPEGRPPSIVFPGTSISPLKASLTINGITQRFGEVNSFRGLVQKRNNITCCEESVTVDIHDSPLSGRGNTRSMSISVYSTTNNFFDTSSFDVPFRRTLVDGDRFNSFFNLVNADSNGSSSGSVFGNFAISQISFSTLTNTGVPEPASWLLLIVGFGLVGCSTRRIPRLLHPNSI